MLLHYWVRLLLTELVASTLVGHIYRIKVQVPTQLVLLLAADLVTVFAVYAVIVDIFLRRLLAATLLLVYHELL